MKKSSLGMFAGLSLSAAAGCGERLDRFHATAEPMAPAAIEDRVVIVDRGRDEAHVLDVSSRSRPARRLDLPANPLLTTPRNAQGAPAELLVLCGGQPDDGTAPPEDPALVAIPTDGAPRVLRLDSAFNRLEQSDDGRYAFLYFDPALGRSQGSLLFNPHEVAIVDLEGQGAVHARALRSLDGSSARRVVFSPPMDIAGARRRLAVVLFDSDVAVLDLNHPDRGEFTVPLSRSGATGGLGLEQVLFSTATNKIFVRGASSNDVYVLAITDEPGSPHEFELSRTQIFAGNGPKDLALYEELGMERLLVTAPGSKEVVIVEPDTNRTTSLSLDVAARDILLFEGPSPAADEPATRALLYTPGVGAVTFLDLEGVEEGSGRKTEVITLSQAFARVQPLGGPTVMLLHESQGLSLLDLHERTVAGISGPNLVEAAGDPAVQKLWLAPKNQPRLGFLDLNGFHPEEVRLDAPIDGLVVVPSASRPRVAVTHRSWAGHVTVLDANEPSLGTAFSFRGFLYADLLDGDDG